MRSGAAFPLCKCAPFPMSNRSDVRLSVVLPAYNEESRLPGTLTESIRYLQAQPYKSEIIVVDDGSTDRTQEVVRNQGSSPVPVMLLSHPDRANHGKGASIRLGMLEAQGEYRLFMDADNSTSLDHVARFWPCFERGFDVVIGSRALKESVIGKHQAKYKEFAGRMGNWVIRSLAVPGIRDTQAGFKMFTGEKAEEIFGRLTIERWGADIELIVVARFLGCRICEVPITWVNAVGSKVTLASYLQVLHEVWRIRRNLRAGIYK